MTGDVVNDAVFESCANVMDRFNCSITQVEYADYGHDTIPTITAGDCPYNIFTGLDIYASQWSLEGYLLDVYKLPWLDFDKPWWPSETVNSLSLGGQMYLIANWIEYTGMSWTRVVFFNGNLLDDLDLGRPYESVKNGTWTLDEMAAYTEAAYFDSNGNGRVDTDDSLGFATRNGGQNNYWGYQFLLESMGISAAAKNSAGIPTANESYERMAAAVEKLAAFFDIEANRIDIDTKGHEIFYNGNLIDWGLRDVDFLYGVVPFPKLDELQENYISQFTTQPYLVPVCTPEEDYESIGIIIEALSASGYNNVKDIYFETALKQKYMYESECMEMLDIINSTRTMDFWYVYGDSNTYGQNILGNTIKNLTVASYMQKQNKLITKKIERLLETFDELAAREYS